MEDVHSSEIPVGFYWTTQSYIPNSTFQNICSLFMSWDSIVVIANGYGLDNRGVGVQVLIEARIFSSPHHPDWLCVPSNL
jgi:hypothetical protein